MTTLELARAIADAVWIASCPAGPGPSRDEDGTKDGPTQAVLHTLHEHDSWFCRISVRPDGTTQDTPYEFVQLELFQ